MHAKNFNLNYLLAIPLGKKITTFFCKNKIIRLIYHLGNLLSLALIHVAKIIYIDFWNVLQQFFIFKATGLYELDFHMIENNLAIEGK